MVTEPNPLITAHGPADAEILRLRHQLTAREEVIRQLNRRIIERPENEYLDDPESDQDALADALAGGSALESEVRRLRQVVAQQADEIASLRHQLGVYDRLGLSTAVGGVQKVRSLLHRPGGDA
jgi:hypothetical protein